MSKQIISEEFKRMQKLAGLIVENFNPANLANEYGIPEYIIEKSIKYEQNEDRWDLEFDMMIPYNTVPEFDYPEEAKRYFKKQFDTRNYSGPGQYYSRGGVYNVSKAQDGWYVQLAFDGGMDI